MLCAYSKEKDHLSISKPFFSVSKTSNPTLPWNLKKKIKINEKKIDLYAKKMKGVFIKQTCLFWLFIFGRHDDTCSRVSKNTQTL